MLFYVNPGVPLRAPQRTGERADSELTKPRPNSRVKCVLRATSPLKSLEISLSFLKSCRHRAPLDGREIGCETKQSFSHEHRKRWHRKPPSLKINLQQEQRNALSEQCRDRQFLAWHINVQSISSRTFGVENDQPKAVLRTQLC